MITSDPMAVMRMSFPADHIEVNTDRCGTCACWSWLPESNTEKHELIGRCLHTIRGTKAGLLGRNDGERCPDWQRDDPI